MILKIWRWFYGFKYEWEEYHREEYRNGTLFLFKCNKTGRFKKIWLGGD
jgi:hypothetical protein